MCGRFGLTNPQRLAEAGLLADLAITSVAADLPNPYPARHNVAPSQPVLAVLDRTRDGERERTLAALQWGLVPRWAKDATIGHKLVNARAETLVEKPTFRAPFTKGKRCVVLADVFYEWQDLRDATADPRNGDRGTTGRRPVAKLAKPGKQPWAIRLRDGEPFAFAGLWETWRDPADPGAAWLATCTLITTTPNALVRRVHDRMPVLLPPGAVGEWLDPDTPPERARELLVPYDATAMEAWPISLRINTPAYDEPDVLEPTGALIHGGR
ncbi:SOS response-associated peptidase [Roseisolibacter agri]|uniref:Abasic site processing protein n=1 Tax=Roseisolibacter agri TaxID=2014610 RepID=A0AA37QJ31_9BACT|nr:SOS response-associated peptidase [Roseisolibacter agri]GLC26738.1 DUF159 family protein [Roseisolibacter agri]